MKSIPLYSLVDDIVENHQGDEGDEVEQEDSKNS